MLGLWKPWFLYRPQQLVRRAATFFEHPGSEYAPLAAAWGMTMLGSPAEHLGQCLRTTGIYDLAVSEALFRLVRPGDLVVDAGANVGYMTLLSGVACGPSGRVIAFEPNPGLFSVLKQNVDVARSRIVMAPVELREAALGPRAERATLMLPDPSARNNGLAYIRGDESHPRMPRVEPGTGDDASVERSVNVPVETLDDVVGERLVGLLKVDVEGYEFPLLQGAARALSQHRIRHVVFEDFEGTASAGARFLQSAGYKLFTIGWSMTKPILDEARVGHSAATGYEAPSYLATIAPEEAVRACAASGWRALRKQTRALTRA
jgi:FkbM family methyltransferase